MKKVLNIAVGLLVAAVAVAGAQAGPSPTQPTAVDRIIAQEDFKGVVRTSTQPTAVEQIIAQEQGRRTDLGLFGPSGAESVLAPTQPTAMEQLIAQEQGRHADPRLFGLSGVAPVQIVVRAGGFDWADAGIGGAAALALALLAAAGVALRHNRLRHGTQG